MGKEDIRLVGRIDREIYRCIETDIATDEVIITDERIAHINEKHPGDYEVIAPFISEALTCPDYIIKDDHHEGTCIVLKHIQSGEINFQIVLRLQTSTGTAGFKNSVLSAWRISKRRWENYLKNKTILYRQQAD